MIRESDLNGRSSIGSNSSILIDAWSTRRTKTYSKGFSSIPSGEIQADQRIQRSIDEPESQTGVRRDIQLRIGDIDGEKVASGENKKETENDGQFRCLQCDSIVSAEEDDCPECGLKYVEEYPNDLDNESADPGDRSFNDDVQTIDMNEFTCLYFDVAEGIISYTSQEVNSKIPRECEKCGTPSRPDSETCLVCGYFIEDNACAASDMDLGYEIGKELEGYLDSEIECPLCGASTKLHDGICESCGTLLISIEDDPKYGFRSILPMESVIFIHLDVETGKVKYLTKRQRSPRVGMT